MTSDRNPGYAEAGRSQVEAAAEGAPAGSRLTDESESYTLQVNGREESVKAAWLGESLLYVLRERLGLPGSKNACEQGECGSCSVFLDGTLVVSCCVLAADAVDSEVVTVEGLEPGDGLSDVQQHFLDAGAVQCGFCTPGLIVAVHDLLDRVPDADELTVREAISGNLCRCTGYGRILQAVVDVQRQRAGTQP
ncbi:MAG: (2Fe-2S)-binding protein [Euzebyaceae bacterium]|jgi:carbon-monoxide dehydrogenase small subunit|nr:(2Fe-2S)-binding protein [Euzebyaceae bacterium]